MIRDTVNDIAMRRPGPYEVRSFCADCNALDFVARLVIPFARPILVCRSCRQKRTGVLDTRNMRTPIVGTAEIATERPALPSTPPVRGLLMAGAPVVKETPGEIVVGMMLDMDREMMDGADGAIQNPRGLVMSPEQVEWIFASDDDHEDELRRAVGVARDVVDVEAGLDALDRELDEMIAELDRREGV